MGLAMRFDAPTALRIVTVVLVALAGWNLASVVVFGGPFYGVLSTAITLSILAALAWWIASRWPSSGTPLTLSPFWRTALRVVGVLALIYDATYLALLPFLGGRVLGSLILFAVIGTVLIAVSFVGRRAAIDVTLLPPPAQLPYLPPPPPYGAPGFSGGLPYLPPPPPDARPWVPSLSAPELERARAATVQTVAAAYAQARARVVLVVKLAVVVVLASIAIAGIGLPLFGVRDGFVLIPWAFASIVFGVVFLGWYASILLIDDDLSTGRVPGPEHPLPPAIALYRWGSRPTGGGAVPPAPSWDAGTIVAMVRFGRRMTRHARSAAWAILVMIILLAGPGAYILTFATLLRFGGGMAHIAADAGAAVGALLLVWLAGFIVLYRYYRETDRIDLRFAELERALLTIERDFWARF